jgi:hypothetical protein
MPPALADILGNALAPEVTDRPTATEFRQQLERYLAGQASALRALSFPDGDSADEREELLVLAIKHWDYAAGILHDGTIAHWLRRSLHDPVAAQAAEAAVSQWPNSPDAALDAFVRGLSPTALPPGKLELRTPSIRLPNVGPGQQIRQTIELANRGQGYLRGEILSTQAWLTVDKSFACPPGRVCAVPIEIDTTGLVAGQPHLAAVTLMPVGGTAEVVAVQVAVSEEQGAPVQITLTSPTIDVSPGRVDLGTVDRKTLSTPRVSVTVTNISQTTAQVRVRGAPRWLLVKPGTFRLVPGARQVVNFVGRVDKIRGRKQRERLTFAVDGGRDQEIEVSVQVKGGGLFGG